MARYAPGAVYALDFETVVWSDTETAPQYYAFPGLCEASNGDRLVAAMRATDHATTRDGKIVAKRSVDDGATFGAEFTIHDTGNDLRDPDLTALANGDLLCSFTEHVAGDHDAWVTKSTDDGVTWGAPVLIASVFDDWTFISGRVVELPSGVLLAAYYGQNTTGTLDSAGVSKSVDGGATWAGLATIRDGDAWGRHAQEPCLAYDPARDRVWCSIRSDTATAGIYLAYSDDDGVTWSNPTRLFDGSGRPAVLVTAEGGVALAYRQPTNNRNGLRWSWDGGLNWSAVAEVNSTKTSEYASWTKLANGALGLAWSAELSSTVAVVIYQEMTAPEPLVAAARAFPSMGGGMIAGHSGLAGAVAL